MKNHSYLVLLGLAFFSVMTVSAQTETRKVVDGKTYIVHKVASGETLYGISKKYNTAVKDIQSANDLSGGLKAGQEILIPALSNSNAETSEVSYHTVASGETLSGIARKYNTTVDELKSLNSMSSVSIKIGQTIKVPSVGVKSNVKVAEDVKPEVVVVKVEEVKTLENKSAESKPAENKPTVAVKKPAGPRNDKSSASDSGKKAENADGGMPRTAEVLAETATEKEEVGTAMVKTDQMDQTRTFVMHPSLPKGSIIVVINEKTGKMAYCRVVDNIKPSDLNGASVAITKTVADKIGLKDSKGSVKIKYAAP